MKKLVLFFISCLFFSISMQAQPPRILPDSIRLDKDTIIMAVGQDTTLTAHIFPYNTTDTNRGVTWEILGQSIDTLFTLQDTICRIHGLSDGTSKIVVKTNFGNHRDTCIIQVVIPATGISLSKDTIKMTLDSDTELIATILPNNATFKSIDWSIADSSLVGTEIVNDTICLIKALAVGEALIHAITIDGGFKDSCVIEISTLPVESLTLNVDSIDLFIGEEAELTALILPAKGIIKNILWYSLNDNIVDVSSGYALNNIIKAKNVGEAKIVVKSAQDELISDTCVVTVHGIPAEKVILNHDTLVMIVHADTLLKAQVFPFNTTNDSIKWISTDSSTIDIISPPLSINDTICFISARKSGTATIIATTFDGGFRDSCFIKVVVPTDSVVVSKDSITMDIENIFGLKAVIHPDTATFKSFYWTTTDKSIVDTLYTVGDSVYIQANKAGLAYVFATTADGLFRDTCVVTVNPKPVSGVRMSIDSIEIDQHVVSKLTATVLPVNATNQAVVWTSSDSTIVDILSVEYNSICNIKALKVGEAIIYVTTNDGNFVDSCVVNVLPIPISGFVLSSDSMTIYFDNDFYTYNNYLEVTISPYFAANKEVEWTSSDSAVVDIISMSMDSIIMLKAVKTGTALIFVRTINGDFKDSCFVTVKDQFVVLETDTTSVDGIIEVSLIIPENEMLSGSFILQLPRDFGLAKKTNGFKSLLDSDLDDDYDLEITRINDSVYIFDISSKIAPLSRIKPRSGPSLLKLMYIGYTIYEDALFGSKADYLAKFLDVAFNFDEDLKIEDDRIDVVIKSFRDPTSNVVIGKSEASSYFNNNQLYVNSEKAETIQVYSLNGQLLFSGNKYEGTAVFNLNTPEKTLIVKGSSGWSNLVVNP